MINIHPSDKPAIITGCIGGTITSLCNIPFAHDLIKNICVTATGAVVSFIVSYALNVVIKKESVKSQAVDFNSLFIAMNFLKKKEIKKQL